MKKYLIILFFSTSISTAFSAPDTLFFSKEFGVSARNDAKYYRFFYKSQDNFYQIKTFYLSGKLQSVGHTKKLSKTWSYKREGVYTEYHENGKIKERGTMQNDEYLGAVNEYFSNAQLYRQIFYSEEIEKKVKIRKCLVKQVFDSLGTQLVIEGNGKAKEYGSVDEDVIEEGNIKNGLRDSVWIGCYKNGKLCYKETYENGKLVTGISQTPDGKEGKYKEIQENPQFEGGIRSFYSFLSENIVYPENQRLRNQQAKVFLKFAVEKDGTIKEYIVLNDVHPEFEYEAVRVLARSDGKWIAGKNRAIPVRVWFTLPIVFALN